MDSTVLSDRTFALRPKAYRPGRGSLFETPLGPLDADPDQHDDDIQALALTAVVLVRPHAVPLLVPVRAGRAVHAASPDMRLALGVGSLGAHRDVRLLGLDLGAAAGLIQGGRGDKVLYDGAVAGELVLRVGALRRGFGDDFFQERVL